MDKIQSSQFWATVGTNTWFCNELCPAIDELVDVYVDRLKSAGSLEDIRFFQGAITAFETLTKMPVNHAKQVHLKEESEIDVAAELERYKDARRRVRRGDSIVR